MNVHGKCAAPPIHSATSASGSPARRKVSASTASWATSMSGCVTPCNAIQSISRSQRSQPQNDVEYPKVTTFR